MRRALHLVVGVFVAALVAPSLQGCGAADSGSPVPNLELTIVGGKSRVAPGSTVEVQAALSKSWLLATYSWTVRGPGNEPVSPLSAAGKRLSFVAARVGQYEVSCRADVEGGAMLSRSITVEAASVSISYRLRLTPPPQSGMAPLDRDLSVSGEEQLQRDLTLTTPPEVALEVRWQKAPMAVHVVAMLNKDDSQPQRRFLPAGSGSLPLSPGTQLLLIPEIPEVAPLVRSVGVGASKMAVELGQGDAGQALQGHVESLAAPLGDATVALRTVDAATGVTVPSTLAKSDAKGAFELKARPGAAELVVVPPAGSELPVARVADPALRFDGAASGWVFRFAAPNTATIGGKVVDADGKVLAGARVRFVSEGLTKVGQLEVAGKTYSAQGSVSLELETDASGALVSPSQAPLAALPLGTYQVEIRPPADATASVTRQELVLAKAEILTLRAERKAKVSGVVSRADGTPASARVELRDSRGVAAVGVAQEKGEFSLTVDRGYAYTLAIRPLTSGSSVGALLRPELKVKGDQALGSLTLPAGTRVFGKLRGDNGAALVGVSLQVYCEHDGCPQRGLVDEVRSGAGGTFELVVPRGSP